MKKEIISIGIVILIQFFGIVWYISKTDTKVNILYDKFEKESDMEVVENQVKMKMDLANLIEDVKQIKKDLRQGNKKDKEIMDQHKELFKFLENQQSGMNQQNEQKGAYSYGN